MAYACLVQLRMLYNTPTSLSLTYFNFILPCSEEQWSADTAEKWLALYMSEVTPPTPNAPDAFAQLFLGQGEIRYSEFGGYVMIIAILSTILDRHRIAEIPTATVAFSDIDIALDSWQKVWQADPRSRPIGPTGFMGALAFNASAVYRVATINRVFDYSR